MRAPAPLRFAHVARDLTRLLGVNVITRALGIVALIIYARLLPPTELAALPVFFILGSFVTVPLNFGLFPTLMREVPALLERDRAAALGMIRTVAFTVGGGIILVGAAYAAFAPALSRFFYDSPDWAWLFLWIVPGAVARGIDDILTFVLRSTREFGILAEKKLVIEVATPVAAVAGIWMLGVRGLVLGLGLGVVLGLAWGAFRARAYLVGPSTRVALAPLVRRSAPYYAESGLFFLTNQGDQALVAVLMSPMALAAYYLARRIPDALGLLLLSIEEVMGPTLARARVEARNGLDQVFRRFTVAVAAFVLPTAALAACFAWAFTRLIGAEAYAEVTPAIVVLALGLTVQGAMTIVSQSALALGHPRDRLKVTAVWGVLLLVLTAVVAPWGLVAVAAGRVAAVTIATVVGARLLRHLLPPIPWSDVAKLVMPSFAGAATALLLQRLSQDLRLAPVYAAAAVVVFLAVLFAVTSPVDRQRVAGVWRGED